MGCLALSDALHSWRRCQRRQLALLGAQHGADEVVSKAPKAKAGWDLSAYKNAPTASDEAAEPEDAPVAPASEDDTDNSPLGDEIAQRERLHALRMRLIPA